MNARVFEVSSDLHLQSLSCLVKLVCRGVSESVITHLDFQHMISSMQLVDLAQDILLCCKENLVR